MLDSYSAPSNWLVSKFLSKWNFDFETNVAQNLNLIVLNI